jgi:hypothetical protein
VRLASAAADAAAEAPAPVAASTPAAAVVAATPDVTASTPDAHGDVKGDMLTPSVANTQWVRALAAAVAIALAARSTAFLPASAVGFVHIFCYGSWLGTLVWTTFIAGITMFRNLPRQTFGRLQSKLFPAYFALSAACCAIMLGSVATGALPSVRPRELYVLGAGLAAALANLLFIEPKATAVMFKRYDLENAPVRDDAAIKALYKQFGKWHGISSLVNLVMLVAAVGHGWYLGGRLAMVGL